jgi:hypothetical protein
VKDLVERGHDVVRRLTVEFLIFLGFVIAWFALQRFVLPGLGVPT